MEEKVFGNIIPILTEEEYENRDSEVWHKREEGDAVAILQVMYHIASHAKDKGVMLVLGVEAHSLSGSKNQPSDEVADLALKELIAAVNDSIAREANKEDEEKREKFLSEPYYTKDGKEPNAVLVMADGGAELVHLSGFVNGEDLGEPIGCESTSMVLNKIPEWSRGKFGVKLGGYVDSAGMPKGLMENDRIQSISGYDYIAGDCVLVRIDDKYNYLPLNPYDAVVIWKYFN